ncbi:MAG: hypothetical protein OEV49_08495 [candidate division Zixibacteria bacterium]|nr:hypothetical protein [candidate division Zixibacteria bacterium]MDH3937939.1 hypothetical protein [candidate division Zixibacteria bacterium]MDH4033448.1 hypothetical protein [candidate division Zixibacteria bacterium]
MVEALSVIAALIAIGGFIWAMIRHFRPEKAKRAKAFSEATASLAYGYSSWRDADFASKYLHLLSYDDFKKVALHRDQMAVLPEGEQLFMFVCSIVHGLWGDWMPRGIPSERVLSDVITLLDGRPGWRPVWRAAYIIESLTDGGDEWIRYLPGELQDNSNAVQVREVIGGDGVIAYLVAMTQGDNSHLRDKAYATLQEIDAYSPGEVPPEFNKANVPK